MIFLIVSLLFHQFDEDHLRMITSIKVAELTQILQLDEHQIAQIIPKVRKLEDLRFKFQKKRHRSVEELKVLLRTESKAKVLKTKLTEYKELKRNFARQQQKLQNDIEDLLNLEQKIKFLIFQEEFEHRLGKIIQGIRQRRPLLKPRE